jgi:GDP-4-dehydro-6-deoxy-D-mannose reductase
MPVWLVTGGSGFVGRHLLKALTSTPDPDRRVIALGRRCPGGWPLSSFATADLEDPTALAEVLGRIRPEVIIHAAGRTPPAPASELYRTNTLGTIHLLDALRTMPVRIVLVGSAAELGPVEAADLPIREGQPCRPPDAYGLSKWLASAAGLAARPPLDVVVARVFNAIGPGLSPTQAFGRFAAALRATESDPVHLTVGDLEGRRDFIDVRDVVRALIELAHRGRPGQVYHVGTGASRRVGEGLEYLIHLSRRRVELTVASQEHGGRGVYDSRADIRRIVCDTGWRPEIPWEQSLEDLWEASEAVSLTLTS